MVQRNVLYTASDPSETHVVPVGSKKATGQAVHVAGAGRRHSTLAP